MSIYAAELPPSHHVGWVSILRHLLECKSLSYFAWRHLWTTGNSEEYTITGIPPLNPPSKIETSTHVRACDKEGCDDRAQCPGWVKQRVKRTVIGRLALEKTFSCMIANFGRMKLIDWEEEWGSP